MEIEHVQAMWVLIMANIVIKYFWKGICTSKISLLMLLVFDEVQFTQNMSDEGTISIQKMLIYDFTYK